MKFKTRITKILKKAFRCSAFIALSIVVLFLLLAIVVYLPPVQQIIKNKTTEVLSRETGLDIKISKIRLSFPLDLLIDNMSATDRGNTIVAAQQLLLDVKLLPLIEKKIELNGFELHKTRLNTKDLVSDINIDGRFNLLAIDKPAICDLDKNHIDINKVRFQKADINITLSDTAQQDTTTSKPSPWLIKLNKIDISDTQFCLHTPGDTINVGGNVARLTVNNTILDLKKSIYRIENISLGARKSIGGYHTHRAMPAPHGCIVFNKNTFMRLLVYSAAGNRCVSNRSLVVTAVHISNIKPQYGLAQHTARHDGNTNLPSFAAGKRSIESEGFGGIRLAAVRIIKCIRNVIHITIPIIGKFHKCYSLGVIQLQKNITGCHGGHRI